jgi:hypothetical protein
MPGDATFRTGARPTGTRYTPVAAPAPLQPPPTTATLTFVEAPYWSHAAIGGTNTLNGDEFQINYATNELRFGRPLADGEWAVVSYRVLQPEPVPAGRCMSPTASPPFDVATMTGKNGPPGAQSFAGGDTIGSWVTRNVNALGANFLNDGTINRTIEFRPSPGGFQHRPVALVDRRLDLATGQFLLGSSFGITQMTMLKWIEEPANSALVATLNEAFDLNRRCLYELMPDPTNANVDARRTIEGAAEDSLTLSTAYHAYYTTRVSRPTGPLDQEDWTKYWSKVFRLYNAAGRDYCTQPEPGEPCAKQTNGLSWLIQVGVQYDPSASDCNKEFGIPARCR